MIYSSLTFVFFAVLVILVFYFMPRKARVFWLCLASFAWYSTWNLNWALTLFGILTFNYVLLRWIRSVEKISVQALKGLLLVNIATFIVLKVGTLGFITFATPYGSSFFMFMIFAYIVDLMRGAMKGPIERADRFFLLPSFFPVLVGGPIERAKHFLPQLIDDLEFKFENVIDGAMIFSYGFSKKACLTHGLNILNRELLVFASLNPLMYVPVGLVKTIQAYVDFSSYCDMGRGVARCFGIDLPVNFRAFYYAKNPSDYWQRWNITLGTWIRDYISFPMMLNWGRVLNQNFILFCSFVVVGLWHGFTVNWLIFGIFNGLMVILFNLTQKKFKISRAGYLFCFVIFIGNGLLQQNEVLMQLYQSILHFEIRSLSLASPLKDTLAKHWPLSFYVVAAGMFVMDYVQEQKNEADWYTKLPMALKATVVAAALGAFLYSMDTGRLVDVNEPPPVYFKL